MRHTLVSLVTASVLALTASPAVAKGCVRGAAVAASAGISSAGAMP